MTGRYGQLASSLRERSRGDCHLELTFAGRPEFDLTDRASVLKGVALMRPDVVVSAAAYTAVDRAEDEADIAYQVNVNGAAAVAAV